MTLSGLIFRFEERDMDKEQLRIIALEEAVKLFKDCSKYDRGDVIEFAKRVLFFLEKGK